MAGAATEAISLFKNLSEGMLGPPPTSVTITTYWLTAALSSAAQVDLQTVSATGGGSAIGVGAQSGVWSAHMFTS